MSTADVVVVCSLLAAGDCAADDERRFGLGRELDSMLLGAPARITTSSAI
ncbi:MAG TPA: hypothetical protein VMJ93_15925 [Verrucomicrobiae bacterium]|nr:hypothetical protein [Verrucomicrobiae bacterium]